MTLMSDIWMLLWAIWEVILFECIKSLFVDYGLNGSKNAARSDVFMPFLSLKLWMETSTDMHSIWAVWKVLKK